MISAAQIIFSMLEDIDCTMTMRPMKKGNAHILSVMIPQDDGYTIHLDIHKVDGLGNKIKLFISDTYAADFGPGIKKDVFYNSSSPPTIRALTDTRALSYDLTSIEDFHDFRQVLYQKCHNNRVMLEFDENKNLDFLIA